jgi:hypothetical protein
MRKFLEVFGLVHIYIDAVVFILACIYCGISKPTKKTDAVDLSGISLTYDKTGNIKEQGRDIRKATYGKEGRK